MKMPASVGIDLVDVTRIAQIMARYGPRFLDRILGVHERAQLDSRYDRAQFVAGRFAAKEATIKALGRYLAVRPSLTKIEVINDETGKPSLHFDPSVARQIPHVTSLLSLSHERTHAIAIVICSEDT